MTACYAGGSRHGPHDQSAHPGRWPALEGLFGPAGASNGCWCMYWRLGPRYRDRPRENNRHDLRRLAAAGPPPGLLAFDGDVPVGWCELAPRADLSWLAHARYLQPVDDLPVWSVPCFYVLRTHRGQGVMGALIEAAVQVAASASAPAPGGLPRRHGRSWPQRQPIPRDRGHLRPARLRCRGPAQARPPGHAPQPRRADAVAARSAGAGRLAGPVGARACGPAYPPA
jgi:GNAT superfamily N-acetyltransferase